MRIPMQSKVDMAAPANQPKLIHAGDEWLGPDHPHLLATDDSLRLMGNLKNGMTIDPEFGTMLQGKVFISESPENISFAGGYWRMNPMLLASFGSMAAMPVPFVVADVPNLLQDANDIDDLVARFGF